jgi:prolyl 4-hydroxylase
LIAGPFLIVLPRAERHPRSVTDVETAYRLVEAGDAGQAVQLLERRANEGDAASLLELGVWFLDGRHVRRDLARARDCFRRAGELGDLAAEQVFIAFLANGIGGGADWRAAKDRLLMLAREDAKAAQQLELVEQMALDDDGNPRDHLIVRNLSSSPQVSVFEDFASPVECEYLISAAGPLLQQSVVVDPDTGQLRPHPIRTSDGAFFPWAAEDLVISALNRRIASASGTTSQCGEPLQVLRYRPGQEYRPHFDALPAGSNQRAYTMLVYLNDGYAGGETSFTRTGLTFAGAKGAGLLFRNTGPGGKPDQNAEHAGLPVLQGEKFVASRWIRERPLVVS